MDLGDTIPERKYDIILHIGARTLIRNSIKAPYEYFHVGLAITAEILDIESVFLPPYSPQLNPIKKVVPRTFVKD